MKLAFRPAKAADAVALSDLAKCSKAYWGYSDYLMELWAQDLTLTEAECEAAAGVAEADGTIAGFYCLSGHAPEGRLTHLFVAPEFIGLGVGKDLLHRAFERARMRGLTSLTLSADPHAEGFYLKAGARRIGTEQSDLVPGRELPLLRFDLP